MKQIIILWILFILWFSWYNYYNIFIDKQYSSEYEMKKKQSSVEIKQIVFDKDKIDKLNDTIKGLKTDPVFKLKLTNITDKDKQPLFIDSYASIYQKILNTKRQENLYSQ